MGFLSVSVRLLPLPFVLLAAACASDERTGPPNILLVLVDDMGFSDVGAFGGEVRTPTLDAIARNGLRFTQFHTTAKCFPSRAALLTGLYPEQVGMDESPLSRIRSGVTIADALQAAGYRTYMVGKHHAVDHPMDLGFDRYVGLRDGAANHFNPGTEARPGEPPPARKQDKSPAGRWWCFDRDCRQGYVPEDPGFYSSDFYTERALAFLDDARTGDARFFLYLAYQGPHDPLHAWPEDIERYLQTYRRGFAAVADERYRRMRDSGLIDATFPRAAPQFEDWSAMSDAERTESVRRMAVYAAMTDRIDQGLARIVADLRESGEFDNTLIVFTSDNGASDERVFDPATNEEYGQEHPIGTVGRWASLGRNWANVSNTPFRNYKNYSHEGGAASPLILHWPAGIHEPGRIVSGNAHLIDLFPTLLAVTDTRYPPANRHGDAPPPLEGMSLAPYLESSTTLKRGGPVFQRWQRGRSVRTERWKLLSYADSGESAEHGAWELYDMQRDRTETNDVSSTHPEVVAELASAYDAWLARVKPEP